MKPLLTILFAVMLATAAQAEKDGHGYYYGDLKVVFIPYHSDSTLPCSTATVQAGVQTIIDNYTAHTYGSTRITATIAPPMKATAALTCANRYLILDQARATYPDYDIHILVGPYLDGCSGTGFGGSGFGFAFAFGCPSSVGPMCHEFGHALGMYHEAKDAEDDGTYTSGYTGDPYDALGCYDMNAPNRVRLHAITPRFVEPETSATVKNYRKGADALKVYRDFENDYTIGFDGTHVTIHYGINVWRGFNPFVADLSVGESWQSAVRGFWVRFVDIDGNGDAGIEITNIQPPPPPCDSCDCDPALCPTGPVCGNGVCEDGETWKTCGDCSKPSGVRGRR